MGFFQAVEPLVGEEGVTPAVMVFPTTPAGQPHPLAEDAPQAHPDPPAQGRERPLVAVLEVPKPAAKCRGERRDDRRKALARGPLRLRSDRLLELLQALRSGAAGAVLEPVAQEVKGFETGVDDPRLGR